jgi:hypothetical protein
MKKSAKPAEHLQGYQIGATNTVASFSFTVAFKVH